jgi:hypothetical protein
MENHPKIFCQDIFRAMCTFSYNDRPVIVHLSDCPSQYWPEIGVFDFWHNY